MSAVKTPPVPIDVHAMYAPQEMYPAREIVTNNIHIGPSFVPQKNEAMPAYFPRPLKAVWDTGAMGTSISRALAEELQLDKSGVIEITGVTGTALCSKYLVSLHLMNGIVIPELEVSDCEGNIGCDVLIGMDVITLGDFAINNIGGQTTFFFRIPSLHCINYVQQLPRGAKVLTSPKPGRNDPCPCGSGEKYKRCHGRSS